MLRDRDDARGCGALRSRSLRRRLPPESTPVRCDDRRRHAVQQNGAGVAQGLRPDGRAAVGDLHGIVRQWRGLLPLFLFRGARLRSHRTGRHLRPGMSADRRSSVVRHPATSEQDLAHEHHCTMKIDSLAAALQTALGDKLASVTTAVGEVTAVVKAADVSATMRELRDRSELRFEILVDVSGVDYSAYGTTGRGMMYTSSGSMPVEPIDERKHGGRFAAVYHLLSIANNWRMRVRVFAPDDDFPLVPSV